MNKAFSRGHRDADSEPNKEAGGRHDDADARASVATKSKASSRGHRDAGSEPTKKQAEDTTPTPERAWQEEASSRGHDDASRRHDTRQPSQTKAERGAREEGPPRTRLRRQRAQPRSWPKRLAPAESRLRRRRASQDARPRNDSLNPSQTRAERPEDGHSPKTTTPPKAGRRKTAQHRRAREPLAPTHSPRLRGVGAPHRQRPARQLVRNALAPPRPRRGAPPKPARGAKAHEWEMYGDRSCSTARAAIHRLKKSRSRASQWLCFENRSGAGPNSQAGKQL